MGSAKAAAKKGAPRPSGETRRAAAAPPVRSGSRFFNRDESWMLFNGRVLEEAEDTSNPLLERVKFLAITASNLDEFIEIRVAGTLQQMEEATGTTQVPDEGGLTPEQRLGRISDMLHSFSADQDRTWRKSLAPALDAAHIRILSWKQLRHEERAFASKFFHESIDPLLTPVTLDPSHPFPRVLNKAMCIALLLRFKRKVPGARRPRALGVITIPRTLPNLIALPERHGKRHFLLLEDLIGAHAQGMFRGYVVLNRAAFRVTRNSNLYMEEEESRSVLERVRSELHNRRKGDAVRLEIAAEAAEEIVERLRMNFELEPWQVFRTESPVNLSRLMDLYNAVKLPDLKFPEFHGQRPRFGEDIETIFATIRSRDLLLHHPFDSYSTVERFITSGTADPRVVSIKQTLYRTSADSPMFRSLIEAAEGKSVTVVVELMARFDEASNIRWARELEDAGVQVFHGIFGLKTHCKLALIAREDADGVTRSYAHLGTGNYNPITARFYTDISLLTARPELTGAVQNIFRYLTADWQAERNAYRPLLVAPLTLADDFGALIRREAAHARAGRQGRIIAKMNALLDEIVIEELYAASQAGVEIDLIIRGMCALRPGLKGLSEHIRVRSVVGRFLEHSRIFWFRNGGAEEVYTGSADWMSRNLYERCEVVFPVTEPALLKRMRSEILEAYLRDTVKGRLLQPGGNYVRSSPVAGVLSAQEWLMRRGLQPQPSGPAPAAATVLPEAAKPAGSDAIASAAPAKEASGQRTPSQPSASRPTAKKSLGKKATPEAVLPHARATGKAPLGRARGKPKP